MELHYPSSKEQLLVDVDLIKEYSKKEFLVPFGIRDPHDETLVFDYIDEHWIEYIYSEIEKVAKSDLFNGDGSIEHKIAYITININLLHKLENANKRSSLLTFFILMLYNHKNSKLYSKDWEHYYEFAKKIAREGVEKREQNIIELREFLK